MTDLDLLDAPAYPPTLAARLTDLHPGRVRRWLRGYEYWYEGPSDSEPTRHKQGPVVRRPHGEHPSYASFLDLIDLLFVNEFLRAGVSLQKLRKALREAERLIGGNHFAQRAFWTDGREIYLQIQGSEAESVGLMQLLSHGQWVIAPVITAFAKRIEFGRESGFAERWYPLGRKGHVVLDPKVAFGQPTLTRRGIETAAVLDLYEAEGEDDRPVSDWFGVTADEVQAAVDFERRLLAA